MDNNQSLTPNPQDNQIPNLDNIIKKKFKLFQGLRSQDEDQKIYDKIMDLCFEEMVAFVVKDLTEDQQNEFLEELNKKESDEEKIKFFQDFTSKVDNFQERFSEKIDTFLDQLLYSSIKNKSN